jgi:2-polyprenyl-3-methyl-5-hydroxy-6-metoxy-1,4-benzoquinol methylase
MQPVPAKKPGKHGNKNMGLRRRLKKIFRAGPRPVFADEPYENQQKFSGRCTDIKAVCFYLPQFHRIPENDSWWGEGFTEWTNTRKAKPLYKGHYQPRKPHSDIGEYDLTDVSVLEKQAAMAKNHGISGFCFYHYYFNGKKLLEKPLKLFLEHPGIDIKFCLCWANGHWTRAWDGRNRELLIEQRHSAIDDIEFIKDIAVCLKDARYIRIGGNPLLLVYDTKLLPDPAATAERWRTWCRENGIGEICLATVAESGVFINPADIGFDWLVEFPPHPIAKHAVLDVVSKGFHGRIMNYKYLVNEVFCGRAKLDAVSVKNCFRGAMLHWDNSARTGNKAQIWENFSYKLYYKWLRFLIQDARARHDDDRRYIFINAWNEWAEGTYLEPDQKHGYKALNTTSKALFDLDFETGLKIDPKQDVNSSRSSRYDQQYSTVRDLIAGKDANNSWSLLANKIRPGCRVLEFGPASGYMTRYLKEELGCEVYVVEIDPGCADRAKPYAAKSFVGDIETFGWAEQWGNERFDIILFADVLEHLRDPWKALHVATRFLKSHGRLLASIPNLAHNSVLIELWANRFTYRHVGLLDNTHLRFFSEASVKEMFVSAGLDIRSLGHTHYRPRKTEFENSLKALPWIVRRAFAKRPLANAYQFIIEAAFSPATNQILKSTNEIRFLSRDNERETLR